MLTIKADSVAEASNRLVNVFKYALNQPYGSAEFVSPRGNKTIEISPCLISISRPEARLQYSPERDFSLMHAINESLMLFNKEVSVVDDFPFVDMSKFADDEGSLEGSYGWRSVYLLEEIVKLLQDEPDSRQAVIPILSEWELLGDRGPDIACTQSIQFLIRGGKLDCFVNMRSNDFIWGFPYDVFQFTMMHEALANTLKIELGTYYHYAASMHVYERHFDLIEKLAYEPFELVSFKTGYVVGEMQWLCEAFKGCFRTTNGFANSLILNDIMPPFTTLVRNEIKHRKGEEVQRLSEELEWAKPFTKRWRKAHEVV